MEGVRTALARGEDVNAGNENDHLTGLMLALSNKHNSMVELLLQQPTLNINKVDIHGATAFHLTCATNNVTGLRMLLADRRLTSVNARNVDGWTPLMMAVVIGSEESVRELVGVEGVDLEIGDFKGMSVEEAARWVKRSAIVWTNKITSR